MFGSPETDRPRSLRPGYLAPFSKTRNIIFEACVFGSLAYTTKNITFEAR